MKVDAGSEECFPFATMLQSKLKRKKSNEVLYCVSQLVSQETKKEKKNAVLKGFHIISSVYISIFICLSK